MAKTALAGVKVVELCELVAGPYCTKLMADLGAEVIKVEKPGIGDAARRRGPFLNDIPHPERSGLFFYLNTNKLGVTLNLESAKGREIFKELVKDADILVEDSPPASLPGLGLGYDVLKELNPRLIMTSITPFGQTGPYKDYKAYPLNTFHSSGEGYVTPGQNVYKDYPPLKHAGYTGEYEVGTESAVPTLGALYYQRATGKGQHIDASKQEALITMTMLEMARYPNTGELPTRGTRGYVVGGILPCKDGFVEFSVYTQRDWENFVKLMGEPEWAKDEKFKDPTSRAEHGPEVNQHLIDWLMQHNKQEIYHQGQKLKIPVGAYFTPKDVVNSEQMKAREFFAELEHPELGRISIPKSPYKLSKTPWRGESGAPLLGEHNEEVYHRRLGYSKQEMMRMAGQGII